MNSDIFDRLPLHAFIDRDDIVVPTLVFDHDTTGGLFGFRFDCP